VFAFVFYFPSALCGPSFDFTDFKNFIELKEEYANIPKGLAIKSAAIDFAKFVTCIGLNQVLNGPFSTEYCTTEEFGNQLYIYKVFVTFILVCIL
jgi:hypothetical protein